MATVELYHFWSSVCSVRVRMALEEKGVVWTSRYIDLFTFDQLRPDYLVHFQDTFWGITEHM